MTCYCQCFIYLLALAIGEAVCYKMGGCVMNGLERDVQGGSNMTGTDLCVNKPHCAAAVRP